MSIAISNAGGDWNSVGTWVGGVVPTSNDDVVATGTSGNLTISIDNMFCRSLDFTNYVGIFTINPGGIGVAIGNATGGDLKFVMGMTFVCTDPSSYMTLACSTTGHSLNVTSAGKMLGSLFVNSGVVGNTYTLQDNLTCSGTFGNLVHGNIVLNNKNVTCDTFLVQGVSTSDSVNYGSGTITCTGGGFQVSSNCTVTNSTSCNIVLNGSVCPFTNNKLTAQTWGNLTIASGTTCVIRGINTFSTLTIGVGSIVTFPASKTTTVASLSAAGTLGNLTTLKSSISGTAATISQASGTVSGSYLSIKDINANGGATFNAGIGSVNVSGNTGINFLAINQVQSTGIYASASVGGTHQQSTGGLSGGLSSAHKQSTGDLT